MAKYTAALVLAMLEGRHGTRAGLADFLQEGSEGHAAPLLSDFRLRDLAETICGHTPWWKNLCARMSGQGASGYQGALLEAELLESGTPTSLADFKDIIGQLLFNQIKDGFKSEEFKFSKLVPVVMSKILGAEKIPEMGVIGDEGETVLEGEEYPTVGYGSNYYTWPAAVKKGLITEITSEALFADLTKRVTDPATKLGKSLGLKKEKRIIDVFIGQVNNYSRNGTATDSYLTAGAYVNASVIALQDETDVDEVEQAMIDILHPETSEPIELTDGRVQLVCVPALRRLAARIARSTEVRETDGANVTVLAPPTLEHDFDVISSKLLYRRILAGPQATASKAKTWWFLTCLQEALAWKENWGIQGFTQGPDSEHAFMRDVQFRWKANYRGEAVSNEPRYSYRAGDAS